MDRSDARRMLVLMNGRRHQVHTGVTVYHCPSDIFISQVETTVLQMQDLPEEKLAAHLDSNDWVGKAGAFGFQDGLDWVHVVDGLESNVVGLPVEILPEMIQQVSLRLESR